MMCRAASSSPAWHGVLHHNEYLSKYTVWGIGGPADRFYKPADLDDLCLFLADLPADEPLFWLGLGSNILVRDGGIRGTVIHTAGCLNALEKLDTNTIYSQAGVACAKVAKFCARNHLGGCEFFAGIPGTVGGALAMNAGAFGGDTYEHIFRVETLGRNGIRRWRPGSAFNPGYRHVEIPADEWFIAAEFKLNSQPRPDTENRIRGLLRRRSETQPTGLRSCGSVFRNPPGDHAARLIESTQLKGHRIGEALVSNKHANFIINCGGASAADVEALIRHIQQRVEIRHGVRLHPEVCIVGEAQ